MHSTATGLNQLVHIVLFDLCMFVRAQVRVLNKKLVDAESASAAESTLEIQLINTSSQLVCLYKSTATHTKYYTSVLPFVEKSS